VAWWYETVTDFVIKWELSALPEDQLSQLFPLRDAIKSGTFDTHMFVEQDMIIVGEVEECREKIERYQRIGCDAILCYMEFGGLPHESIMTSIELLGTEIIPVLEKNARSFAVDGFGQPGSAERVS
jgi:hypothetical protein